MANWLTVNGNPIVTSETKVMRIVRTVGGARRFGQPKGSIIVRDGQNPLDALVALPNDREGYEKVADQDGNVYYVGFVKDNKGNEKWIVESGQSGEALHAEDTAEDIFAWLNTQVGGSGGKQKERQADVIPIHSSDSARMRIEKGELNRPQYGLTQAQGASIGVLNESELIKYRQLRDRGLNHSDAYKLSREGKPSGNPNLRKKQMDETKVHGHRPLERAPGKRDNWVEIAGSLPPYIEHIAQALHERRGMTISHAIATAINRVKRWAAGLDGVSAKTKAKAIKALAEWTALKAKNAARKKK